MKDSPCVVEDKRAVIREKDSCLDILLANTIWIRSAPNTSSKAPRTCNFLRLRLSRRFAYVIRDDSSRSIDFPRFVKLSGIFLIKSPFLKG